jgi:cytochrome c
MHGIYVTIIILYASSRHTPGATIPTNSTAEDSLARNAIAVVKKHGCTACHDVNRRVVGPAFIRIAERNYSVEKIVAVIKQPEPANWLGYPSMPALKHIPERELMIIGEWIRTLGPLNNK